MKRKRKQTSYLFPTLLRDLVEVYADIEGHTIGGGTIPPDILVTSEKPDIVIINKEEEPSITIIELTVPWEERIETSREIKTNKYSPLISDLSRAGYSVDFISLEVGTRGIITNENKHSIKKFHHFTKEINLKTLTSNISKKTVISSYYIFLNRNNQNWAK